MGFHLRADVYSDPAVPTAAIVRRVWLGGSTDDGYWPEDHWYPASEIDAEISRLHRESRIVIEDHRPSRAGFRLELNEHSATRREAAMSVNGRPFAATRPGPCPAADRTCRHGGQIRVGDEIKPVDGLGWIHEDDVIPAAEGLPVGIQRNMARTQTAAELAIAAEADRLLDAYESIRENERRIRQAIIPTGNYTIRPADETTAAVISVGPADFGSFPEGTRKVAMHGSFSILIDGLSQHRSWYGFAIVKPGGSISVYKNARAILNAATADLREEDRHLQAKLRLAIKSLRLLTEAGESEILRYGKAYASGESKCWRCERPLLDETSQRLGIGPSCLKTLRRDLEQGARA